MYYKGERYEPSHGGSEDLHGRIDEIRKELAARIELRSGMRVLDLGTGFGKNTEFLSSLFMNKGTKIWTIDPSEDTLKNVEESLRQKRLDTNITFVKGSAEELPFEDDFFDIIVSIMVLHHLQSLKRPINEMLRVLKKGGKLILVDYGPESHVLQFSSRHKKEDFFEPENVVALLKENHNTISLSSTKFQYWYIIEAAK